MSPLRSIFRAVSFWNELPPIKWLGALVLVLIMWPLINLLCQEMAHRARGPDFREEMNHMRQIGMALYEFEFEFGRMPDDSTADLVRERHPDTPVNMDGRSANHYFHQLIAAEIITHPRVFHGRAIATTWPPQDWETEVPLPPGTCGFAYIVRDAEQTPPFTPLVVYPLIKGERVFKTRVDSRRNKRALVLYADSSVRQHAIDSRGRIIIDGLDFFDPEAAHWNGREFRIAWPD